MQTTNYELLGRGGEGGGGGGVTDIHYKRCSLYTGTPAVITLVPSTRDVTFDDVPLPEACLRLEEAGASVVGLNCGRGPETILPLIAEVRKVCKVGCMYCWFSFNN